jgi:hypothetical protein
MKRFITFSTIVFLIDSVEIIPSLIVVENLVASFRFEFIKVNFTIPLILCANDYTLSSNITSDIRTATRIPSQSEAMAELSVRGSIIPDVSFRMH